MPRQNDGSKPLDHVAQIPFELIEAATTLKTQFKFVDGDNRKWLITAYDNIHRCLMFIAGGDCDLSALPLTQAQRAIIRAALDDAEWAEKQCGRIAEEAAR